MFGQMLLRALYQFVIGIVVVFLLLAIFAFFSPNEWFKAHDQVRLVLVSAALLLVVAVIANLIVRGLWKKPGRR